MKAVALGIVAVTVVALCAMPGQVAEPPKKEPLVEQVRRAIDRGIGYLRGAEDGKGHLEAERYSSVPGGSTSLAMLALLSAGVRADDPLMQRCLKYQRGLKLEKTYQVGLQTAVFALAGQGEDRDRIQRNVDWLLEAEFRDRDNRKLQGWGYSNRLYPADNSNSEYALLGLHEGFVAGAKMKPEAWQEILDFYAASQKNGGWSYRRVPDYRRRGAEDFRFQENNLGGENTLNMTTAGLCGLFLASRNLDAALATQPRERDSKDRGRRQQEHIEEALKWLDHKMPRDADAIGRMQNRYYFLCNVERAGRLSEQRLLGGVDWYILGCEYLIKQQRADGSWIGDLTEADPLVATSFALLFLVKGRTPVLLGN